jgi:hypothetical protein
MTAESGGSPENYGAAASGPPAWPPSNAGEAVNVVAEQAGTPPHAQVKVSGIIPPLADPYHQRPETGLDLRAGLYPGDTVVLTHGRLAHAYSSAGRPAEAVALCEQVVASGAGRPGADRDADHPVQPGRGCFRGRMADGGHRAAAADPGRQRAPPRPRSPDVQDRTREPRGRHPDLKGDPAKTGNSRLRRTTIAAWHFDTESVQIVTLLRLNGCIRWLITTYSHQAESAIIMPSTSGSRGR